MDNPQRWQGIDGLNAERLQLEEQAGIAAAMTRAREEPVGDIGEDESSVEYLANAHRHIRRQTRDAYFCVQDESLRKKLIAMARRIERQRIQTFLGELASEQEREPTTFASALKPWMLAVFLVVFFAAVGYFSRDVPGAVVGGLAGLIVGLLHMAKAGSEIRMDDIKLHEEIIDESLQNLTFGDQEERGGQRDRTLDPESVLHSRVSPAREQAKVGESHRSPRRWERLGESQAVRFVAIALIGLGALLAYAFRDEMAAVLRGDPPAEALRPLTSLKGVRLGETLADVIARKGAFDKEPPGKSQSEAPDKEGYVQRNGPIRISVRKGLVSGISYECQGFDWTRINRVACHDPEERIRTVFGEAVRVLCAKVGEDDDPEMKELAPFVKAFDVLEAGTRYVVIRNAVSGFIVLDTRELEAPVGGSSIWHECD